jgi:AbrB family looped-hinge helix DNA binding protein
MKQPPRYQELACASGFRIESVLSIDERGQMVLPKEVRDRAGIGPGDKLALVIWERQGAIYCMSLIKTDELTGMVKDLLGPMAEDLGEGALAATLNQNISTKDTKVRNQIRKQHNKTKASTTRAYVEPEPVAPPASGSADILGKVISYADEALEPLTEGETLDLSASNPADWTVISEGQIVLDLGSGVGFDCFLAAAKVGSTGRVIGVDMTPEMVEAARENALKGNYENVEFRLGELENLPIEDNFVDLVISNCAINLSSDKRRVFKEAFRVLKPGGTFTVADIVLVKELPPAARGTASAYADCVAGALLKDDYIAAIRDAGFDSVEIAQEASFAVEYLTNDATVQALLADEGDVDEEDLRDLATSIRTLRVCATKPLPVAD